MHAHSRLVCDCGNPIDECECYALNKPTYVVAGGCGRCVRARVSNQRRADPAPEPSACPPTPPEPRCP